MSIFSGKKMQTQKARQSVFAHEEPIHQLELHREQNRLQQRMDVQEEHLLRNEQEVVRDIPAANEDMAVAREQVSKKKKEVNIAARSKEEQHGSFSEVRRNAFQDNLRQNISMDIREIRKDSSEEFISVLVELESYAQMEQSGRNSISEGEALANIRKKLNTLFIANEGKLEYIERQKEIIAEQRKIRQYEENEEKIKREHEIVKRYKLYFDTFCSGQLTMSDPYGKQMDTVNREVVPTQRSEDRCVMKDVTDMPLFTHEPSMNDIHQAGLGDCYYEAAIGSLVSEHPERVKELMKDNGDGTVTVCLYRKYESMDELPPSLDKARKSNEIQRIDHMSNYDILINLFGRFKYDIIQRQSDRRIAQSEALRKAEQDLQQWMQKMASKDYVPTVKDGEDYERIRVFQKEERKRICKQVQDEFENDIFQCEMREPNAIPAIDKISRRMAEDARFIPLCEAIRAVGGEYEANRERIADGAFEEIRRIFTAEVKAAIKREYEEERKTLHEPQQYAHYITVKKEIPVDKETGKPLYTDSPLWVHMYQKAYAASGFRRIHESISKKIVELVEKEEKELEKKNPHLSEVDKQKILDEYQRKLIEKYRYSYENIEDGEINEALEMIQDVSVERKYQEPITFKNADREVQKLKKDTNAVRRIRGCLLGFEDHEVDVFYEGLKKRMKQMCKTIKVRGKDPIQYTETAITIEDVKMVILDARNWEESDFYKMMYQKLSKERPGKNKRELEEELKQQLQILADSMEQYYEQLEGRLGLQHKKFEEITDEKGTKQGKYTRFAVSVYKKIEEKLTEKKPLGIGTKEFVEEEVAKHLRWKRGTSGGESIGSGLAQSHAYSIIGCMEKQGHFYVALKNPWGAGERIYTRTTKKRNGGKMEVTYSNEETRTQSGEFYMELNDLLNSVDVFYGLEL